MEEEEVYTKEEGEATFVFYNHGPKSYGTNDNHPSFSFTTLL